MGDVLPLALVISNKDLVIQPIRLSIHSHHVLRKTEEVRQIRRSQKFELRGKDGRRFILARSGKYEPPLPEGRNVYVIRPGLKPGLLDRVDNTPVRLSRKQW